MRSILEHFLLLFFCLSSYCNATYSSSSSTITTNTIDHDIRALDEYGNSKQLLYAMKAANNGRLIIILTNMPSLISKGEQEGNLTSNAIWVISPTTSNEGTSVQNLHRRPSSSSSLLYPIIPSSTYMIATGIRSDIQYIIQQLQLYYKYNYERYNTNVVAVNDNVHSHQPSPRFTMILQLLLRRFWNYPTISSSDISDDEDDDGGSSSWIPIGYQKIVQESQQQQQQGMSWGRPMGIRGSLIQYEPTKRQFIISDQFDSTGCSNMQQQSNHSHNQNITISCMGPNHSTIRDELMKVLPITISDYSNEANRNEGNNTIDQAIVTCIDHVLNKINNNDKNGETKSEYQLEILDALHSKSIQRKVVRINK